MQKLSGIISALWTPTGTAGEILWPALESHLQWQIDAGIDGVMALGSTGEFVHLSLSERKEVLDRIIRLSQPHGKKVIANISATLLRHVVELGRHAREAGADAIAVLPPWYYGMEQRDLARFFIEAARAIELPLLLYNYPEMTGKKIELETVRAVAGKVPVIGIKQSGGEFSYHHDLIKTGRELGFTVLTGADIRLEEALGLGCSGTICGLANAVPDVLTAIYRKFVAGERAPAETRFMQDLAREIASLPFPPNVKATIEARGFETGALKNPLSPETQAAYSEAVERLRKLYGVMPGA